MQVGFRLNKETAKRLNDVLISLGFTSNVASENYIALVNYVCDLSDKAKTAKTLKKVGADCNDIQLNCDLRFKVKRLLKDIDPQTQKTFPIWKDIFYCFRWDNRKGRPEKPLELLDPLEMCKRCKPILEEWLKTQEELKELAIEAEEEPRPAPRHLKEVLEQQPKQETIVSTPTRPVINEPPNSWNCPKRGNYVHFSICLDDCKICTKDVYVNCQSKNPDINRYLTYWRDFREKRLKQLALKKVPQENKN